MTACPKIPSKAITLQEYRESIAKSKGKKSKYKNDSCSCVAGHVHMSRGEARYCETLFYLKKAGQIKDYEIQKKVELFVGGRLICNHYVDFWVTLNDGKEQTEDFKGGFYTDVWKIKHKLFQAIFPDIKYKVVLPRKH